MKSLKEVAAFHGHLCPGLAIGYRAALIAVKEMGKRSGDEEIVAIVENDSCSVDAVQVMTGCTFGKGNLIFRDYGKQVYTFLRRPSGAGIRVSLKWSPGESEKEKAAWEKYIKGDRSEAVLNSVRNRRAKRIKALLGAKDEELFNIEKVKSKLPIEAKIYPSVVCEQCGERVMEPRARVRGGKLVCLPCFGGP